MCWVECFSESDSRWITVDPLSGQVDRPESIGPRRDRPFSYVLGFAGGGAKDVTRRYAVSWQVVERMRTSKHWWYALMAPLERRERAATNALASWGGVALAGEGLEKAQLVRQCSALRREHVAADQVGGVGRHRQGNLQTARVGAMWRLRTAAPGGSGERWR